MRLPAPERRRQIIDTAAELFSRRGFSGTTTREVAKAAGVSEATLFKHFATKEELYAAIIEAKAQTRKILDAVGEAAQRRDDAEVLRLLGRQMLTRTKADPTLMRLLFFSALEGHTLSDMFLRSRVEGIDNFLSRYIAERTAAGVFRAVDPLQAAWNFIGMVSFHLLLSEVFGQKPPPHLTIDVVVDHMVSLFLDGVRGDPRDSGT
jgi:AcrR family transcriptional regulator